MMDGPEVINGKILAYDDGRTLPNPKMFIPEYIITFYNPAIVLRNMSVFLYTTCK